MILLITLFALLTNFERDVAGNVGSIIVRVVVISKCECPGAIGGARDTRLVTWLADFLDLIDAGFGIFPNFFFSYVGSLRTCSQTAVFAEIRIIIPEIFAPLVRCFLTVGILSDFL